MLIYEILDVMFLVFHTLLIFFNILGWIWRKTRKWNLITLIATVSSWLLLGYFYGWGYCILTDWHWNILIKLGKEPSVNSYIQYLFQRLLSINLSAAFSEILAVSVLTVSFIISVILNIIKRKH